jgi:hypothetical protein
MVSTLLSFWYDASKQQQLLKEFKHAKLRKPNAIFGGQNAHIDIIETNAYLTHHVFFWKNILIKWVVALNICFPIKLNYELNLTWINLIQFN